MEGLLELGCVPLTAEGGNEPEYFRIFRHERRGEPLARALSGIFSIFGGLSHKQIILKPEKQGLFKIIETIL